MPTFRFKLLAFATGAFIGGLAGALYASRQNFINPDSFLLLFSILFLAAVVVGGQGNRWGVLVGAALVAYLPQRFREFDDFRVLVFGLALVVLATLRPEGLFPPKRTVRAKQVEHELDVPLDHGVHVVVRPPVAAQPESAGPGWRRTWRLSRRRREAGGERRSYRPDRLPHLAQLLCHGLAGVAARGRIDKGCVVQLQALQAGQEREPSHQS